MPDKIELNEISLNIFDIVQNSIKANASLVHIYVNISTFDNLLTVTVKDNGSGFDVRAYENTKNKGKNKHGGYGISLFKESAEKTGGRFKISSSIGYGTEVTSTYILNSPCRAPLGDINATIETLIFCCANVDFVYTYEVDGKSFTLNTKKIKEIIGNIPINNTEVSDFVKAYLKENTDDLNQNRIF